MARIFREFVFVFLILFNVHVPHAENISVSLILEHAQSSPWNDLLIAGLEKAGRDFSMRTRVIIAPMGAEQESIFRKAAEDSQIVIVASDNLHEILRNNAANYRKKMFGSVDAGIRASNVMSVTFADEQASYLAGVVAAMMTDKKGTIAWLSGMDTPALRSLFNGYEQGAKLVSEDMRVIQGVAGSFTDPQSASQKAAWLVNNGAGIVALAAGSGNAQAKKAVPDVWLINLDQAQNDSRSLGTIIKAADRAVYDILKSAASGKFGAKEILVYNLANKGVDFILNKPAVAKIAQIKDIERRLAELRHELANNSIYIKSMRQRTLCDCLD